MPVVLEDGARKYVWGLGLAYHTAQTAAGEILSVYHTDGLGSVRALTNSAGTIVQSYTTDEYGVPSSTTGGSTQPFRYTGEQRDGESGFYYLRARVYDPATGRFMQRDSYPGSLRTPLSLNRFSYALLNPVRFTDPSGHSVTNGVPRMAGKQPAHPPPPGSAVVAESKADNNCLTMAGGAFGGYVVSAACLETPLMIIVTAIVQGPGGRPYLVATIVLASPPRDEGGGGGNDRSLDAILNDDQLFDRWVRHKFPADRPLSADAARKVWDKMIQRGQKPFLQPGHPHGQWRGPHINDESANVHIPVDPSFTP